MNLQERFIQPNLKAITAFVAGFIPWLTIVSTSAATGVTSDEWIALAVIVAQALGVYTVVNKPKE